MNYKIEIYFFVLRNVKLLPLGHQTIDDGVSFSPWADPTSQFSEAKHHSQNFCNGYGYDCAEVEN